MASFRFRPQAALDLRRRQHDVAQRELARADAERQCLAAHVESAAHAVARAQADSDGAADQAQREWYRFWIVKLAHEHAALRSALDAQDAVVAARRTACLEARKRQEALERLRERAHAAYAAAEAERERKMVDEVAAQRFARRDLTEGV